MITVDTAEIVGIFVGDGYLRYEGQRKEVDISGNIEEKEYYDNHVVPLFNKTFNTNIKARYFPTRNTYGFVSYEPDLIHFFKGLGFPSGAKGTTVRTPSEILTSSNKKIITSFLQGYFDTDGNLYFCNRKWQKCSQWKQTYHYYPHLSLSSVSSSLIKEVSALLSKIGLKYSQSSYDPEKTKWNIQYILCMNGIPQLTKWMGSIGMANSVKLSRYQIWQTYGFCPPHTTLEQRRNILKGVLDPYLLYKGP